MPPPVAPPAAITTNSWLAANVWVRVKLTTVPVLLAVPTSVTGLGGPEELEDIPADEEATAALLEGVAEDDVMAEEEELTGGTVDVATEDERFPEDVPASEEAEEEEVGPALVPEETAPLAVEEDTAAWEDPWLEEVTTEFPEEPPAPENVTQWPLSQT